MHLQYMLIKSEENVIIHDDNNLEGLCNIKGIVRALGKSYIYCIYYFSHNCWFCIQILGIMSFSAWPSPFRLFHF